MALDRHQMFGVDSRVMKTLTNIFNNWLPSATLTWTNKTITGALTGDVTGDVLDGSGYITHSYGAAIPTAATAGYAPGALFNLTGASLGQSPNWINQGSATSCLFVPYGPVLGYGFALGTDYPVALTDADPLTAVAMAGLRQSDLCFATKVVTDGADQFRSVKPTSGAASVAVTINAADPTDSMTAHVVAVRNKCEPIYDIFAAGERVAVAGDDATVAITVTGVLTTDIAFANYVASDDTDLIQLVVCTADTVTVTCSADPEVAHTIAYMVLRQRGTFTPSHYIAYAGDHTTVGGAVKVEAKTVTGVAATDIVISNFTVNNSNTDFIEKVVASANTITWTVTDDPTNAHALAYLVLRAY